MMESKVVKIGPGQIEIILSGDLGIENIDDLHQLMKIRLANAESIQVRLNQPVYIDLAVYQLLAAVSLECKNTGKKFVYEPDLDPDSKNLSELSGFTAARLNTAEIKKS